MNKEYLISIVNQQQYDDLNPEKMIGIIKDLLASSNLTPSNEVANFNFPDIGFVIIIGFPNGYISSYYEYSSNFIEVYISLIKEMKISKLILQILKLFNPEKYSILLIENKKEEGIDISELDIQQ